jgi:hypothetical protein
VQLVNPPRVSQGTKSRCWCAALSSLLSACGSPCYSLEALTSYVRTKAGSGVVVNGDGSLRIVPPNYAAWTAVVALFGMDVRQFYPAENASMPHLSAQLVADNVNAKKYTLLIYKDPVWSKGSDEFWHAHVAYGIDDANYVMVMDPDGGFYGSIDVLSDLTYLVSSRSAASPWVMS